MRVVHIITGLEEGGAESLLYNLVITDMKNEHIVISLQNLDKYGSKLKEKSVVVFSMGMEINFSLIFKIFNLIKNIKKLKPSVIQTWMYHANLIGGFASMICGVDKLFWSLHHHKLSNNEKFWTKISCYLGGKLSSFIPNKIVSVSDRCTEHHISIGYCSKKLVLISNGINTNLFNIEPRVNNKYINTLNPSSDLILIGMAARYNVSKDFKSLIKSISIVQKEFQNFNCIAVGPNVTRNNKELMNIVMKNNVSNYFIPLGPQDDLSSFYNAIDINILSSNSESFGLVLAEAMACGTPCISSDVGEARKIIGNTGWIVPKNSYEILAKKIKYAIISKKQNHNSWLIRKDNCRKRIIKHYSLNNMINKYINIWSANY
jgi:glycosyltransferase involved in cell wall biosynthesis